MDDPKAHIRTEFGFDMVQVARTAIPQTAITISSDFEISKELLDRAFLETYGLNLSDVFGDTDLAIEIPASDQYCHSGDDAGRPFWRGGVHGQGHAQLP